MGGTRHAQFDRVFHQQCASSSGRAPTLPKRIPRREPNHPTETPSARKYNIRTCNCETLPVWSCAEEVRGSATEHAANAAGYPRCSRNSPPCTAPPPPAGRRVETQRPGIASGELRGSITPRRLAQFFAAVSSQACQVALAQQCPKMVPHLRRRAPRQPRVATISATTPRPAAMRKANAEFYCKPSHALNTQCPRASKAKKP